ncbi:hypothetical protein Avbf_05562 [Armadillidium vulgare]|nr:hypothetical protein Avbf_05562 [Armadillidium vulgare]
MLLLLIKRRFSLNKTEFIITHILIDKEINQEVQIGIPSSVPHFWSCSNFNAWTLFRDARRSQCQSLIQISSYPQSRITTFQAVPLLCKFIASCDLITKDDLKSTHSFVIGGSPLSTEVAYSLKNKAPTVHINEVLKDETQNSGEIIYSPLPDLKIPNKDIFSYFYDISKSWQHKTFTECGLSGKKYTFGQTNGQCPSLGRSSQKDFT